MSRTDDLLEMWRREERPQPDGWDFSGLASRMSESEVPWNLEAEYRQALRSATRVLDMGTGGGEFLLTFSDLLPADTVATEAWPPNVMAARSALEPRGIDVVEYGAPDEDPDSVAMPFPDGRFNLVLNRHESYSAKELARLIEPGGVFLTQQVGGDECGELADWFGSHSELPHVNYDHFSEQLREAGFSVVDGGEHVGAYRFADVAALLAYLHLVPWELPEDFSVDRYAEQLLTLHARTSTQPLKLTRKRFWLKAERN